MGRTPRKKPQQLAHKLRQIRQQLGITQSELAHRLEITDPGIRKYIAKFETGQRQPNLLQLLQYARLAKVRVEQLIDDELELVFPTTQPQTDPETFLSESIHTALRTLLNYWAALQLVEKGLAIIKAEAEGIDDKFSQFAAGVDTEITPKMIADLRAFLLDS